MLYPQVQRVARLSKHVFPIGTQAHNTYTQSQPHRSTLTEKHSSALTNSTSGLFLFLSLVDQDEIPLMEKYRPMNNMNPSSSWPLDPQSPPFPATGHVNSQGQKPHSSFWYSDIMHAHIHAHIPWIPPVTGRWIPRCSSCLAQRHTHKQVSPVAHLDLWPFQQLSLKTLSSLQ